MTFIKTILFSSILIMMGRVSWAQDFDKGFNAFEAGDFTTALEEWRPLADDGDAEAQLKLGAMHDFGKGVVQDYEEAAKWYRRAADQGHILAQFNLAAMYYYGNGVIQDYISSHMWANIAAANGNNLAISLRDIIEREMTLESITTAQSMARKCLGSGYKDCG